MDRQSPAVVYLTVFDTYRWVFDTETVQPSLGQCPGVGEGGVIVIRRDDRGSKELSHES